MEAQLIQVLNGITRSMAHSGLKKGLSFEAVRLASQELVQQRPRPERRFGGQHEMFEVTKISSEDRILQRTGDQTFEGCTQDRVQQPIVVPEVVEQLEEEPKTVSESGPDPVLPEQIAVKMRGVSWLFYDAAMISSQDQNVQRTVEQIVADKMSEVMEKNSEVREAGPPEGGVIEAAETSSRDRNLQRFVEPDLFEQNRLDVEVVKSTRRNGFLNGARLSKCPRSRARMSRLS